MPILRAISLACLLLLSARPAISTTWLVGPSREFTTPCEVSALVQNADTVLIDAATYMGDVCSWRADSILLKGAGIVVLDADGNAAEKKAIWVIKGDGCIVDGVEFHNCEVADRNGAGIRVEGTNIVVSHCTFRRNQDGILAGNNANSVIVVEHCEFDNNGAGDGLSHAIYINHIRHFIFRYNYSHGTKVGHEFKSRALVNDILYNRLSSEMGTGSRNIDLPNGGRTVIMGNIIQKGPNTENGNLVGYGLESLSDTVDNSLYVAYNTIVNERPSATFFRIDANTKRFRLVSNIMAGPGTVLIGTADSLDTLNNLRRSSAADVMFVDLANLDYRLLDDSPARSVAVDAGWYDDWLLGDDIVSLPLKPLNAYLHQSDFSERHYTTDMGAYQSEVVGAVINQYPFDGGGIVVYPNPAHGEINIIMPEQELSVYEREHFASDPGSTAHFVITDVSGRLIDTINFASEKQTIDVSDYPVGRYQVMRGVLRASFVVWR